MINNLKKLQQKRRWQQQQKQYRLAQGRLTAKETATQLTGEGVVPLATFPDRKERAIITIPTDTDGHLLIVAPPDSGWREQLAMILNCWPAAALVVDPDGHLYSQTGSFRERTWGKVYRFPGYRFNLTRYYHFWESEPARRLHRFLVQTSPPVAEDWLLQHSAVLIEAIGCYAFHYKINPIDLLLDSARTNLFHLLDALDMVEELGYLVTLFSTELPLWEAFYDKDVRHSFALFCHQMKRYQHLYGSFVVEPDINTVPNAWVKQKGSLYLTFSSAEMVDLSGLAAAMVDGIHRYHQTHGAYKPLLLVMDAAFARRLPPIERFLADSSGYNITVILMADSLSSLNQLALNGDGAGLAGRFAHQVWYPPHDHQTAAHMSWLYGTELWEAGKAPRQVLSMEELLAWHRDQVLVYTRQERPYRFLAERVTTPADWPVRPSPIAPKPPSPRRSPTSWLPLAVIANSLPPRPKGYKQEMFLLDVIPSHKDEGMTETEQSSDQQGETQPPNPADSDSVQPSLPLFSKDVNELPETPHEITEPPAQPRKTTLR